MGKRILFGVLNWGLGHASRSSVLINELINQGNEVVIASDGLALEYLRREFPNLESRDLPAYDIKYSKLNTQWPSLIASLPRMARVAAKEKALVDYWVEEDHFQGIISDNRLGFHNAQVPSAYITHQLAPQAGVFTSFSKRLHAKFYKQYTEVWVPDTPSLTLSGGLNKAKVQGLKYIGPISALKKHSPAAEASKILVVLSGPEPQRTILEQKIFEQSDSLQEDLVVVRGTTSPCDSRYEKQFRIYDFLGSEDLSKLMGEAKLVVSRSGYCSLMDYYHLGKRALLIPTPGQSEQEYLGEYLKGKGYYHSVSQKNLNLIEDIKEAMKLKPGKDHPHEIPENLFSLFSR